MSFQLIILKGNIATFKECNYLNELYTAYEEIWSEAFFDLGETNIIVYSDNFTRQDIIFGIYDFSVNKCIAIVCYKFIKLNEIIFKDSWFKSFNSNHKEFLCNSFDKGVIVSLLGVRKEYRNKKINFAEMICASSSLEMLNLEWDCIITQTRNDRNVNQTLEKIGSIALDKNIPKYNTYSDIVYFTHESISKASKEFNVNIFNIYDNRLILKE